MSEPEPQTNMLEFAIAALRSNQDVLLHKVERTQVVRDQLALNLSAIRALSSVAAPNRPTPEEET